MKKLVFIMDPLETIKVEKDTTYYLMSAANKLGYTTYYSAPEHLSLMHDSLRTQVTEVVATEDADEPFNIGSMHTIELSDIDAVFIRTDPPFDRRYNYVTLFLDRLPEHVKVINPPNALRNHNEKLAALEFPDLTPDTLVTNDTREILAFSRKHQRLTLKPIDGYGGHGIEFIDYGQVDADKVINAVSLNGSHWIIAQQYLPEASAGDKRILLLDGSPIGAILRVHADGKELNNLDQGGEAVEVELNAQDIKIVDRLRPWLIKRGIRFCGIDIIGESLIEINITSPTGLRQMAEFSGRDLGTEVIKTICA